MFHVKHSATTTSCSRQPKPYKTHGTRRFLPPACPQIPALPTAYLCASLPCSVLNCAETPVLPLPPQDASAFAKTSVRRETCSIYNKEENNAKNIRKQASETLGNGGGCAREPLLAAARNRAEKSRRCCRSARKFAPALPARRPQNPVFFRRRNKNFYLQKVCFRNRLYIIN